MKHKKALIDPEPDWVLLFYEEHQPVYDRLLKDGMISQLVQGIPEDYNTIRNMLVDLRNQGKQHILACFDDGRETLSRFSPFEKIYTVKVLCKKMVQKSLNIDCYKIFTHSAT